MSLIHTSNAMKCPYSNCGGEIKVINSLAYCEKCDQPVLQCKGCQVMNNSLALFCRKCGEAVDSCGIDTNPPLAAATNTPEPVRIGVLNSNKLGSDTESKSAEIKSYGGFLWSVDSSGVVYRIPTRESRIKFWSQLPASEYFFPFILEADEQREPVIYVASKDVIYKFNVVRKEYSPLYNATLSKESLCSGVLKINGSFYFLVQRGGSLFLKCIGRVSWEKELGSATSLALNYSPLCEINNSLWVLGKEKFFIFPGCEKDSIIEEPWHPLRVWPTKVGIWYSKRMNHGGSEKHLLFRMGLGGKFTLPSEPEDLALTARIGVSPDNGDIAIFEKDRISVKNFKFNSLSSVQQDNKNPDAILLNPDPPFLCWYEQQDSCVYQWNQWNRRGSMVTSLWISSDSPSFSQFFLSYGCLFGVSGVEVWRWNLLGA